VNAIIFTAQNAYCARFTAVKFWRSKKKEVVHVQAVVADKVKDRL